MAFAQQVRTWQGVVFIVYFPGCSLLRYMGARTRLVVDIRTGSIRENPLARWWEEWLMRKECTRFQNICVVSRSLAERLRLPLNKAHVLPLGAERMRLKAKQFDRLDLLYVGTLDGRRIEDTVIGFERFLQDYGSEITLTYTIVGDGHKGQLETLRRMVRAKGLDRIVSLPGFVHKTQLESTFDRCNVGVSYVPINETYNCQPVTKTFEYLFAGMPTMATATTENKRVVNRVNGVLIQDTPEGFYSGLKEIYARRDEFDSDKVCRCCPESSWDRIVGLNFIPYIQGICQS